MKNILLMEFKNCMRRKEFKIVFTVLFLLSMGSYLSDCHEFFGERLRYVTSAYDSCIIQTAQSHFILEAEILLLPLMAMMIYSDSYFTECRKGICKSIVTRTDKKKYILAKAVVVFTATFTAFFVPLVLNQLLCFIAFPIEGGDNNQGLPPYDIGFQNYHGEFRFELLRLQSPFMYNLLHMAIIGLFASLLALLGYALYFVYKKSRLSVMAGVFIAYLVLDVAFGIMGQESNSIMGVTFPGGKGSAAVLILWIIALSIFSIAVIGRKGLADEPEIS